MMNNRDVSKIQWRTMREDDLPIVTKIAAQLHPACPEDDQIFVERLILYPNGCLVLEVNGNTAGYSISHPWVDRQPPVLNTLLHALPTHPSTYYIHDVALLPIARGLGAVEQLWNNLLLNANTCALSTMSLVAVNSSYDFWVRHGFVAIEDAVLQNKLSSYELDAKFLLKNIASS